MVYQNIQLHHQQRPSMTLFSHRQVLQKESEALLSQLPSRLGESNANFDDFDFDKDDDNGGTADRNQLRESGEGYYLLPLEIAIEDNKHPKGQFDV
jgi:hypothetical protein